MGYNSTHYIYTCNLRSFAKIQTMRLKMLSAARVSSLHSALKGGMPLPESLEANGSPPALLPDVIKDWGECQKPSSSKAVILLESFLDSR